MVKIYQQKNPINKTRFTYNQVVNIPIQEEQGFLIIKLRREDYISQSTFITRA